MISTRTPDTCTASDGTVTFLATGTCTLTSDAAGSDTYDPAPQATQDILVVKKPQYLGFTASPPDSPVAGDLYRPWGFGGGSDQPVTIGTTTPATCTADGDWISFLAVGTLHQTGNATYAAAAQYAYDFSVGRGSQTIGITSTPPAPAAVGATYTVTVGGGASSQPVVVGTSTAGTCTADATGVVSFIAVGTCTITADRAGDANSTAAAQVTQEVTVVPTTQTVTFTGPAAGTYGGSSTLTATGGDSGEPVTYSVDAATDAGVCAVSGPNGSTVTYTGVGTCLVDADQAATVNYTAATQVHQAITVSKATLIVAASNATTTYGDPAPAVTPSYQGFVGHDDITSLSRTPTCTADTTRTAGTGTHIGAATCSGATATNYAISYLPGDVTVTKAVLTIHASRSAGPSVRPPRCCPTPSAATSTTRAPPC